MNFFQLMFGEWLELLFGFRGRINRAKIGADPREDFSRDRYQFRWSRVVCWYPRPRRPMSRRDIESRSGLPPDDGLKYLRPPLRDVGYFSGCVLRALGFRETHRENPREPEDGEEQSQ